MNYIKLQKKINKYIKKKHSEKRYNHSIEVAKMSFKISEILNENSEKAYIAGLSHDIAREYSQKKLLKLIIKDKRYSDEFYRCKNLYHGPVGAIILAKKFDINDKEILDAVRYHSIGNMDIGNIAKIVFVADYISLDRKHIDNEYRQNILSYKLDEMVVKVVKSTESHLISKGKSLLPETMAMCNWIEEYSVKEKRV